MENGVILVTTVSGKSLDELRIKLALKMIGEVVKHGYRIVVVDGSPIDSDIDDALKSAGCGLIHYEREIKKGMGASRRQCIRKALELGAKIVIWLEPEKYTVVQYLAKCVEVMLEDGYDIVVPFRETLDSYPDYQHSSELRASREIGSIIGRHDLDTMFGPRVMSRKAAELFLNYVGEEGYDNWEILFIPILWAIRDGMSIGSCVTTYVHPPEQTKAEQGDEWNSKRDKQRRNIVKTLKAEANKCGALA